MNSISKMRKWMTMIILACIILSCKHEVTPAIEIETAEDVTSNSIDIEAKFYTDPYGCHHPEYYAHPQISDISELKKMLRSADKVVGYNYNKDEDNPAAVDCDAVYDLVSGELCSNAYNKKLLTQKQIGRLISITTDTTTYTGSWSGIAGTCFIPHIGFGFFKGDSLVVQVNICFVCQAMRTYPYYCSDGLSDAGMQRCKQFAEEMGMDIITGLH